MRPKVIKTAAGHVAALRRIDELIDSKPGTPAGDELELWSALVYMYENEHYPITPADPISAIKFRMEQAGLSPSDLIPYMGSKSRVSEVLNSKRGLSLAMIRALSTGLGIPAEVLLGPSKPESAARRPRAPTRYRVPRHATAKAAQRNPRYGA